MTTKGKGFDATELRTRLETFDFCLRKEYSGKGIFAARPLCN
jgi:hypothetical protein